VFTRFSKRTANFHQTSNKRPALAGVFWIHLLEVCWTFAGSCKHPITRSSKHKAGLVGPAPGSNVATLSPQL